MDVQSGTKTELGGTLNPREDVTVQKFVMGEIGTQQIS